MDDPGGMMREAAGKARPAPSCDLVIFGAGGDLTHRLLMPAIYNLHLAGLLPEDFRIIGVDARDLSDDGFRAGLAEPMRHFVTERRGDAQGALDEEKWAWLSSRCTYVRGDFADAALFSNLAGRIPHGRSAVFYLATAARFFDTIAEQLSQAGMMQEGPDAFRRLVVEKPFGRDLTSAVELAWLKKARFIALIIIWGRRRCRISWRCASPMAFSSRSGHATTSTMCRSPRRKRWAWRHAASFMRVLAHYGT
jgi:glucose-6-phosphate 1-dehydrogenase